jgi:hypothetical protein
VLVRLQTSLRDAQEAQERLEATERENVRQEQKEARRAEHNAVAETLRREIEGLHAEFGRVQKLVNVAAPKLREFGFTYPSNSRSTAILNMVLNSTDQQLSLLLATLGVPLRSYDDLVDAEKAAYSTKPKPAAVITHDSLFSRSRRGA